MRLRSVSLAFFAAAALAGLGASLPSSFAQSAAPAPAPAAVASGLEVFTTNCAFCHNSDSTEKKIGPGLKGFYARGTFADGSKVSDESVQKMIENGKVPMPAFKSTLEPAKIKDVIEYLKTL